MIDTSPLGQQVFEYIDALAALSEHPDHLTRRSLTREHKQANALVAEWMQTAGMDVRTDAIGNIIGRYASEHGEAHADDGPALLLGSHLDTVRNGGRFDGMLGVVVPIVCIAALNKHGIRLPFAVEVVGFCDEEGVRFPSTLLGSRAIAGTLDPDTLRQHDEDGISIADALSDFGLNPDEIKSAARRRDDFLGFVEIHIEQGPVLEALDIPVGVVSAIAGAARYRVTVEGEAGHAGTVPMHLRRDALVAAAECVLAVEQVCTDTESDNAGDDGLVATVGQLTVQPGATNVIPGQVEFTIDIRSSDDTCRQAAEARLLANFSAIAKSRQVTINPVKHYEADGVRCDTDLTTQLATTIQQCGHTLQSLPSGAGHDAMALADLTPIAMLFVRCKGGISHHPDESISVQDAEVVASVLLQFLRSFNSGS